MNKQLSQIQIKDYSFAYAIEPERPVLNQINLEIKPGSFNLFCGPSGSGKTTLLRQMKKELKPKGVEEGSLLFGQEDLAVAFVLQHPTHQIVMDGVWRELAFGLENLGHGAAEIERRIAEVSNFFGIEEWLEKSVSQLSGGEKQILNLASNIILQPDLLILDEPTTQLDPIARRDFLQMLYYVHQETGLTIVLSEHNLNDVLEWADQVCFLEEGTLSFAGKSVDFVHFLYAQNHTYKEVLPVSSKLFGLDTEKKEPPLSIAEGRQTLAKYVSEKTIAVSPQISVETGNRKKIAELKNIWYRYEPDAPLVLKDACLEVFEREILAIVGGNGSGKSTLLYLLSRALSPLKGKIHIKGKPRIALLGQNPETVFAAETVDAVLREFQSRFQNSEEEIRSQVNRFGLAHLLQRHPLDLSGGEKQKVALAKVLLTKPDILLLDEPTNHLDALNKKEIQEILLSLKTDMSIVFVTHDLDFAASTADRVAMLFHKRVVAAAPVREFFQGNSYFTTTTYRLTRDILDGCLVYDDLERAVAELK